MTNFLENVNSVIWGLPMLIFFLFTAFRFTYKSHFFQFRGIPKILKTTIGSFFRKSNGNGLNQFSTLCSVLGACLGTGNIVGVATAIYSGGPGTVFWMWISAFLSMMTAYAENYLGIKYKTQTLYGAFSYIENGLKMKGLSKIYALFCLMSALGMGNMTQSNSFSDAIVNCTNFNKIAIGLAASVICFIIISGGIKRIAKVQTVTVPLMSIFYFLLSFLVLYKFKENIIPCFILIFKEAFSPKALSGFGFYRAMRFGVARGVFSNEAGLGSSTLLHSQADDENGETQGIWAMTEVFIDTILMCTITAITILVTTYNSKIYLFGAQLSAKAYSTIGNSGKTGISLLTAAFAFSSLSSCSFYGEISFRQLFGNKYTVIYKVIYAILIFTGAVTSPKIIWTIADICNGLMAIPNLFSLNCLANEIEYP